jgi:hypothetical protein
VPLLEQLAASAQQLKHGDAPPERLGRLPPKATALQVYGERMRASREAASAPFTLRTSVAAPIAHGVAPVLGPALRSITLAEIAQRVNVTHKDRVLWARVAAPPFVEVGTTTVLVEDNRSDVIPLSL